MRALDPIANRLKDEDEIRFEREFLTGPQREKLPVARDYAGQIGVTMWHWLADGLAGRRHW